MVAAVVIIVLAGLLRDRQTHRWSLPLPHIHHGGQS